MKNKNTAFSRHLQFWLLEILFGILFVAGVCFFYVCYLKYWHCYHSFLIIVYQKGKMYAIDTAYIFPEKLTFL